MLKIQRRAERDCTWRIVFSFQNKIRGSAGWSFSTFFNSCTKYFFLAIFLLVFGFRCGGIGRAKISAWRAQASKELDGYASRHNMWCLGDSFLQPVCLVCFVCLFWFFGGCTMLGGWHSKCA